MKKHGGNFPKTAKLLTEVGIDPHLVLRGRIWQDGYEKAIFDNGGFPLEDCFGIQEKSFVRWPSPSVGEKIWSTYNREVSANNGN